MMTTESIVDSIDANYAPLSVNAKQEIADLIDQLIASTTKEIVERVCDEWCFCDKTKCRMHEKGLRGCVLRDAILKPLNKEME